MNRDAITTLDHFGFLAVIGRDAQKFLQGYTTCDLEQIEDGQAMRGAICNIKGRMLANFMASRVDGGFLLRLDHDLIEPTKSFLSKYIVFSKAELQDRSDTLKCYGILQDKLTQTIADLPQQLMVFADSNEGKIVRVGDFGWEIWSESSLVADGRTSDWLQQELMAGFVWVDKDTSEEYLPQMFNLHNIDAISFEKGCYLGQEIVARMQYRGELKKRLHISSLDESNERPKPDNALLVGAKILNGEGKNVGNIVAIQAPQIAMVIKAGEPAYTLEDSTIIQPNELDL